MKKLLITLLLALSFVLVFAVSVSAESLSNFINVDLTLTDGTQTVAYLTKGQGWTYNGKIYQGYDRVVLYADYTDISKRIDWANVEVFDGRNSEICTYDGTTLTKTGTYPQTLLGHVSQDVSNLKRVYYPRGAQNVADSSYMGSKGYTALEYVWIPNTVESIGNIVFNGANITTLEIEEGSVLEWIGEAAFQNCENFEFHNISDSPIKTIAKNAIRGCPKITTFDFPETLETIGYCAFYQTPLSGKIVIPNSVTLIDDGAFRETKIETLVLGDGPVALGYNLVGNDKTNNEFLKEVYIPIEATFEGTMSQIWFASTEPINFYVIAKEGEDTSAFIASLKGTGRVKFATQSEVNAGTAPSGYNAVIIEGYNKCTAFYENTHNESDDNNCETVNRCSQCAKVMTEAISHSVDTKIEYLLGFDKNGTKTVGCKNDGCTVLDGEAQTVLPIFTAKGYSTNPDKDALCGGFSVAKTLYDAYGVDLKFGMIIANAGAFENSAEMLDKNGKLTTTKGLQIEIDTEYANIDCSIYNFTPETAQKLNLIITMYVITPDGEISYIQADVDYASTVQVGTKTFDSVTLDVVIKNTVALLPSNDD